MRKDRGINRWELVTCALAGHVTYAPDEQALANRLTGTTGLGEVWRCLRCGEFVVGAPHGKGHAEDAPMIMRGKALRQAIIIRASGRTPVPGGGDRARGVCGVDVPRRAGIHSSHPGS
ncbi:hypothetical protein NJB14197_26050 [Mycobacterium montefiorense]|uniref:Uncharacterized protein n=1 Tax=Mycobacterium montefiorense TaxID=154654 RepID=A0AA37PN34_9MYCO|nr:hypothetical protein MmonteBS_21460 [Mycobacterium montefiorense]GKU34912.1 hypothetical protein NJB14191_22580 [Mycobacterium montefiorense]GKU40925.1 hypothetical protein NJB14192_29110 [Mycobacterium montefiorense]GKU47034.1 hypothetical protein NJB14194_36520 [Mycobacterium montefiorense]GKU49154.1 hypothetical protein NJB14195_04010 [Mycobacterium montefiorense]